jgi:Na+/pantothenate symporter
VGLSLALPSVVSALTLFYGVMTAALFVPLVVGLLSSRPGAAHARAAITLSVLVTGGLRFLLAGAPSSAWLPSVAGMAVAALTFAAAWAKPAPQPGATIGREAS